MFKVGDKVRYIPFPGCPVSKIEFGIVKEAYPDKVSHVRVVYKCGENWDNYVDYTSQSTATEQLRLGWIKAHGSRVFYRSVSKRGGLGVKIDQARIREIIRSADCEAALHIRRAKGWCLILHAEHSTWGRAGRNGAIDDLYRYKYVNGREDNEPVSKKIYDKCNLQEINSLSDYLHMNPQANIEVIKLK